MVSGALRVWSTLSLEQWGEGAHAPGRELGVSLVTGLRHLGKPGSSGSLSKRPDLSKHPDQTGLTQPPGKPAL